MRSFFNPLGHVGYRSVAEGNQMASCTALAILLSRALGGDFVVEQPGSSLLWRHPRLQWVCSILQARATCQRL